MYLVIFSSTPSCKIGKLCTPVAATRAIDECVLDKSTYWNALFADATFIVLDGRECVGFVSSIGTNPLSPPTTPCSTLYQNRCSRPIHRDHVQEPRVDFGPVHHKVIYRSCYTSILYESVPLTDTSRPCFVSPCNLLPYLPGYDGGDCCPCTCVSTTEFDCGIAGFCCDDPSAACVDDDDSTLIHSDDATAVGSYSFSECITSFIGDGECDADNNNSACGEFWRRALG